MSSARMSYKALQKKATRVLASDGNKIEAFEPNSVTAVPRRHTSPTRTPDAKTVIAPLGEAISSSIGDGNVAFKTHGTSVRCDSAQRLF